MDRWLWVLLILDGILILAAKLVDGVAFVVVLVAVNILIMLFADSVEVFRQSRVGRVHWWRYTLAPAVILVFAINASQFYLPDSVIASWSSVLLCAIGLYFVMIAFLWLRSVYRDSVPIIRRDPEW